MVHNQKAKQKRIVKSEISDVGGGGEEKKERKKTREIKAKTLLNQKVE